MMRLRWYEAIAAIFVILSLSGCHKKGSKDSDSSNQSAVSGPFSVGGTVTGLNGSVVLRLNGADTLAVNAAGTFTFPKQLDNGTAYSVDIIQQPTNQVCGPLVTNGTGTINGANVTNLQVLCSGYSVGGAIAGLTHSGLVLQVNGSNELSVPASSTSFTFPSAITLINGVLYTVHIKTQPTGQTCTIIDSSGLVTAAAPTATTASVHCVDNVTDGLSGTFKLADDSTRIFVTFYPDGTFILGRHGNNPTSECGPTQGNGIQYGVYRWNRTTREFKIVRSAINTIGECSLDENIENRVIVKENGDLLFLVDGDEDEPTLLVNVDSAPGTLIGSWGDNQAFMVYESTGKVFVAMTRAVVQNVNTRPGIEDGCYDLSGTTAAGQFTFGFTSACMVSDALAAIDTSGPVGVSNLTASIGFTAQNDSLQLLTSGLNPLPFVPGTRIVRGAFEPTTFKVSGTITGLTSTGLGLRLAGESNSALTVNPPPSATSFVLPMDLTYGTPYQVIVSAFPDTPSAQTCFVQNGAGTITVRDITNVVVGCFNASAYAPSGQVTGLTATGLSIRMDYRHWITGAAGSTTLAITSNGAFAFPSGTVPANHFFWLGIEAQPTGQTCTITRGTAFGPVTNLAIACVNNAASQLTGTFSTLDAEGRQYLNFNADGTYTSALIHNDADCNEGDQVRNGNGVEYGIFSWNLVTGAFHVPVLAAVDTNDTCGLSSTDGSFDGTIMRVGNTIELRVAPGEPTALVGTAVESVPGTIVGAFVPKASNGQLLVFHADGTFLWVEVQANGLAPYGYGQERGCYSLADSTVTLTIAATCQPDGKPAYDLNGNGGMFPTGTTTIGPLPFSLPDANTLTFLGMTLSRTTPN